MQVNRERGRILGSQLKSSPMGSFEQGGGGNGLRGIVTGGSDVTGVRTPYSFPGSLHQV